MDVSVRMSLMKSSPLSNIKGDKHKLIALENTTQDGLIKQKCMWCIKLLAGEMGMKSGEEFGAKSACSLVWETLNYLKQWFPAGVDSPPPTKRHLVMAIGIFGCHSWVEGWELPLASNEQRPEMLLHYPTMHSIAQHNKELSGPKWSTVLRMRKHSLQDTP